MSATSVFVTRPRDHAPQAAGWQKLKEFNALGIPLLVVVSPGAPEPVFQSNAYTADQVVDAIAAARSLVAAAPLPATR